MRLVYEYVKMLNVTLKKLSIILLFYYFILCENFSKKLTSVNNKT